MSIAPARTSPRAAKASWQVFVQASAWAATAVLLFTVEPPGHSISGASGALSWASLAKFTIAVLTGLACLAAAVYGRWARAQAWAAISIASLSAGFLLLALYGSLMLPWTCVTEGGARLVIGTDLTTAGTKYEAAGHETCADLLQGFGSDPLKIWRNDGIFRRETELGWIFIGAVSGLGFGLVALLESHKVATRRAGSAGSKPA